MMLTKLCCLLLSMLDFSHGQDLGFFADLSFAEVFDSYPWFCILHRISYGKHGRGKCLYSFSSFFEYWLNNSKGPKRHFVV